MKLLEILVGLALLVATVANASERKVYDLTSFEGTHYEEIIRVKKGDVFEIHLAVNPSTGYTWHINPKELAKRKLGEMIKLIGTESTLHDEKAGAPGVQKMVFEVTDTGVGSINLFHARPWEFKEAIETKEGVSAFSRKVLGIVVNENLQGEL